MGKRFTVSFFWKGERRDIASFCEDWPKNELDASGIAFLAIKSWFQNERLAKPDVARSVELVANGISYNWDTLQL